MNAEQDLIKWINFSNVSISPWWYREIEQKYNKFGKPTRFGPKYSSAIIDTLFYDIDCLDSEGKIIPDTCRGMKNLWDFAADNDYKRNVSFTGGGYQMVIGVACATGIYENVVNDLADKVDAIIDPNISLASLRRVVGSYNFGKEGKSTRNNYCISLTEEEVNDLSFKEHLQLAKKPRNVLHKYGNNVYIPKNISAVAKRRKLDHRSDYTFDDGLEEILENYGYDYDDICVSIKNIIEQPRVGHKERMIVIKYLKDIVGIKYGDMLILLPKLLTSKHGIENDGSHSIEEGQVDSIYSRNLRFFPQKMKLDGYCDSNCNICEKFLNGMRHL